MIRSSVLEAEYTVPSSYPSARHNLWIRIRHWSTSFVRNVGELFAQWQSVIFNYLVEGKDTFNINLDDWLTVHRSITLVDLQIDAQNSYLFIYNTFIKILYMFRAVPCSSSGGLRHNCIYAASGVVTLCRWLPCAPVKKELFLNRCTGQSCAESDDTRGCIYTITTQTSWRWAG